MDNKPTTSFRTTRSLIKLSWTQSIKIKKITYSGEIKEDPTLSESLHGPVALLLESKDCVKIIASIEKTPMWDTLGNPT